MLLRKVQWSDSVEEVYANFTVYIPRSRWRYALLSFREHPQSKKKRGCECSVHGKPQQQHAVIANIISFYGDNLASLIVAVIIAIKDASIRRRCSFQSFYT
jgi:hypothetical protein